MLCDHGLEPELTAVAMTAVINIPMRFNPDDLARVTREEAYIMPAQVPGDVGMLKLVGGRPRASSKRKDTKALAVHNVLLWRRR